MLHVFRLRRAFTLVELLVVIAIIAVLVGLLLPAIQKVREAANRARCQNNLKQIGLAIRLYETDNNAIPPGRRAGPGYANGSNTTGWGIFLMPYLEQKAVYDAYDFPSGWNSANNLDQVATVRLAIMRCPSSAGRDVFTVSGRALQVVDYAPVLFIQERFIINNGLLGTYPIWIGAGQSGPTYPGAQRVSQRIGAMTAVNPACGTGSECDRAPVQLHQITDGTSNTLSIVECAARSEDWVRGPRKTDTNNSSTASWIYDDASFSIFGSDPSSGQRANSPSTPALTVAPQTQFSCVMNCTNTSEIFSFHSGGSNILFLDTSVRFFAETIKPATLAALVTRQAGDLVPAGDE